MAACSTIGIQAVSSLWYAVYLALVLAALAGFAAYDIKSRRVPDWALACFMPVAALALAFYGVAPGYEILLYGLLGLLAGGLPLMAAAMVTDGGVGGGDIKLAALLGLAYGPYGIMAALMIATLTALLIGGLRRGGPTGRVLHLPFVPFIFLGCAVITPILIFR